MPQDGFATKVVEIALLEAVGQGNANTSAGGYRKSSQYCKSQLIALKIAKCIPLSSNSEIDMYSLGVDYSSSFK